MVEEEVTRDIEEALNKIVNTTDQSGNMRKELKKTIYETVSTLRNLFVPLRVKLEEGKSEKGRLERELKDTKTSMDARRKVSNNADTEREPGTSSGREGDNQNQPADRCCHRTNTHENYKVWIQSSGNTAVT